MTSVYLIRHAEALGNVNNFFQGRTDCDISPKGEIQLEYLKERFKNIQFDSLYSSPLIRAVKTAEAVNYYHKLPIIKKDGLMEINGGVFEGEEWSKLPSMFPEAYDLWKYHAPHFEVENGESMKQVYERITSTVKEIVNENIGKTVAVVSHGCAIKNFLAFANNSCIEGICDIGWSDNTAVSKILFDDSMKVSVEFQNDSSHLPAEASTLNVQTWWRDEQSEVG